MKRITGITLTECIVGVFLLMLFLGLSTSLYQCSKAIDKYVREVPCALDKSLLCPQRRECTKCTACTSTDDQCCCLHVDKCTCEIIRPGEKCCN